LGLQWQTVIRQIGAKTLKFRDGFMKRQRGRGRKPGGGGGGGGGGNHNHGNRSLESNGPEVKIRGTAAQIYEKYAQYARDAQSGGDRVRYENFLQHAEHYYRVMAATMPRERLLAQQNGEGGLQQGQSMGEGGNVHPVEGGAQGETPDAMKVMDDNAGEDADTDDDVEAEAEAEEGEREEVEASGQEGGQDQEGGGSGRGRRRRGRRRQNDGDRPNGGGNGGGGDTEARSALDSLARKQGALTGG
jgi:hypothetical protein